MGLRMGSRSWGAARVEVARRQLRRRCWGVIIGGGGDVQEGESLGIERGNGRCYTCTYIWMRCRLRDGISIGPGLVSSN